MDKTFHYYATYSAAILAGYPHGEALDIAYSAGFVDECSKTLLGKLEAPVIAATTQLQMELMDAKTDVMGLQDITRIWSSFHFLPRDLYAPKMKHCGERYMRKYRLICGPNGTLVKDTIDNARDKSLQAIGVSMHVVADTWAHMYFAGTPSVVINNTDDYFFEIMPDGTENQIRFKHSLSPDDVEKGVYMSSIYQFDENNIMNLGHGRAGHLPDYGFCVYKYLPAWGGYKEIIKDNPSDYNHAFRQMIYALRCFRDDAEFKTDIYDEEAIKGYEDEINAIITKRHPTCADDWKAFGEKLSGQTVPEFDINTHQQEYMDASDKDNTFLGKFFEATISQKSMVTNRIYESGSMLAGYSVTPKRNMVAKKMMDEMANDVSKGGK